MVQARQNAGLSLEPRLPLLTFEEFFRQDFDRDLSREPRVSRPVHLPHPARAEQSEDLVRAELGPGGEGHFSAFKSAGQLTITRIGDSRSFSRGVLTRKRDPSGETS